MHVRMYVRMYVYVHTTANLHPAGARPRMFHVHVENRARRQGGETRETAKGPVARN